MNEISLELKEKLKILADEFENSTFLNSDPSQFIRYFSSQADCEVASFIAAMLSFGNRNQFIPKIKMIFELAKKEKSMIFWLESEKFKEFKNPDSNDKNGDNKKFYRFYSYSDMKMFFCELNEILKKYKTFENAVKINHEKSPEIPLCLVISSLFPKSKIVPKGKNSANKRVNMFLRWMIRQNSPVDVGFWKWFSPADLIIPLDTHVIQESIKLGLLPENANASLKTAQALTKNLKQIWQNDPVKGDFALFGIGISQK